MSNEPQVQTARIISTPFPVRIAVGAPRIRAGSYGLQRLPPLVCDASPPLFLSVSLPPAAPALAPGQWKYMRYASRRRKATTDNRCVHFRSFFHGAKALARFVSRVNHVYHRVVIIPAPFSSACRVQLPARRRTTKPWLVQNAHLFQGFSLANLSVGSRSASEDVADEDATNGSWLWRAMHSAKSCRTIQR